MSYLEKSMIPLHRQLLRRPRWGIHGMLFLEATPKSEVLTEESVRKHSSVASFFLSRL